MRCACRTNCCRTARAISTAQFRDQFRLLPRRSRLHTRLVTANYWSGYGADSGVAVAAALRSRAARRLGAMERGRARPAAPIVIDSQAVRARFALPEFTGQLFVHAIGVAGHDVVKYALDTYGGGVRAPISAPMTPIPGRPISMPACPRPITGEQVTLWMQNSQPCPIPARRGRHQPHGRRRKRAASTRRSPPFAQLRARCRRAVAGGALAAADRDQRRQIYRAAALRDRAAARKRAHRACQCRAHRFEARSEARRARQSSRQGLPPAGADPAARPLAQRRRSRRRWRARNRNCRSALLAYDAIGRRSGAAAARPAAAR